MVIPHALQKSTEGMFTAWISALGQHTTGEGGRHSPTWCALRAGRGDEQIRGREYYEKGESLLKAVIWLRDISATPQHR